MTMMAMMPVPVPVVFSVFLVGFRHFHRLLGRGLNAGNKKIQGKRQQQEV